MIVRLRFIVLTVPLLLPIHLLVGDDQRTVEEWIELLGASEFAQRELATVRLAEAGPDVLADLEKALHHPDPEVRARVGIIYAKVSGGWFEERAARFLSHESNGEEIPGWMEAARLLGDSDATRRMFIELSRGNPEFVKSLGQSPHQRALAAERVAEKSRQAQGALVPPRSEDLIALLLIQADNEVRVSENTHKRITELSMHAVFNEAVRSPVHGKIIKELAGKWIAKVPESLLPYALQTAVMHRLPEGAERCRSLLRPGMSPELLMVACYGICELGSIDDLKYFAPLMEDRREVFRLDGSDQVERLPQIQRLPQPPQIARPSGVEQVGQVRDFILAAALFRGAVNPKNHGFPFMDESTKRFRAELGPTYSFAGADDALREKPLKKFYELLESQAKTDK